MTGERAASFRAIRAAIKGKEGELIGHACEGMRHAARRHAKAAAKAKGGRSWRS